MISWKLWCGAVVLWLLCGLQARELDVQGGFERMDASSVPRGWYLNGYHGFKPAPRLSHLPGAEGRKVLHVSDIRGRSGVGFCYAERFAGVEGDKVKVSARVRGKGVAWFGIQVFHDGEFLIVLPDKKVTLTETWHSAEVTLPVLNVSALKPTNSFMVTFGANKDSELFLTDLKATLQEGSGISGQIPLPVSWRAFPRVRPEFAPEEKELIRMPEELDGIRGQPLLLTQGEFDVAPLLGEQKAGNCVWLFSEIMAEKAESYTIGAGADWWMTIYLNGKAIIDTSKHGNVLHPPRMTDHQATGRLQAGKNILAIRFVTGKASSKLALAGPVELRNRSRKFRLADILSQDDYELAQVKRSGQPLLIQGNPTPGLLSVTGQGVYTTQGTLRISLPKHVYRMPALASGRYLATGLRIQNFGRGQRQASSLAFSLTGAQAEQAFAVTLTQKPGTDRLAGAVSLRKETLRTFELPYAALPADFLLMVNGKGDYALTVSSLSDSSFRCFEGNAPAEWWAGSITSVLEFSSLEGKTAELVVDNYLIAQAVPEVMRKQIPLKLTVEETFDPVTAGWKKVFEDDFEGTSIDWSKWKAGKEARKALSLDGKGMLEVRAIKRDTPGARGRFSSGSLTSYQRFKYGYFEAKVRFTQQPGWWAFVFLYAPSVGNTMCDGMEIDIFEDYYMRGKTGRGGSDVLDHNLHCFVGGILKSWNYNSTLPGSPDDFYVIGCKWTPYEITYYLNGKVMRGTANHSPHKTVTFDALNHMNGIAPLDVRIGCNIQGPWSSMYLKKGDIDEVFKADYVRVYEYPEEESPKVSLTAATERDLVVRQGQPFVLEAEATPNSRTQAPIAAAYLFDSGCLIGYKDKPPYRFKVSIDPESYDGNNFTRSGRTGIKSSIETLHVYAIMVQDEKGKAANTDVVFKYPMPVKQSTPWQGRPQVIPGVLNPSHYDEGGNGVAYCDDGKNVFSKTFRPGEGVDTGGGTIGSVATGEWVRMTADIRQAGTYTATLNYGTPQPGPHWMILLMEDKVLGWFKLMPHDSESWGVDSKAQLKHLRLPAGRHVFTMICVGAFNYGNLEWTLE